MAKIKQGILGGIVGSVGSVTGGAWKGIAFIRSKPISVSNPNTAAQVLQRGKMVTISQMGSALLSGIIKPLVDRFAVQMSGYNQFLKWNMSAIVSEGVVTLASIIISRGKMAGVAPVVVSSTVVGADIEVEWSAVLPDAYAQATDKVYLCAINVDGEVLGVSSGEVTRSNAANHIALNDKAVAGDHFRVFLSFLREDGTIVSDSAYSADSVLGA